MSEVDAITTPDELCAYLKEGKPSEAADGEEVPHVSVAVVEVNGRSYAFCADGLSQVAKVTSIAQVPGCASVIAGLASVGGEIIGVVVASRLLSAGDGAPCHGGPMLIYTHAEERIGLAVSAVEEIISVPETAFRKLEGDQVSPVVTSEVECAGQYMPFVDVSVALSSLLGQET
jgi:chemotaxis signal transduction protein